MTFKKVNNITGWVICAIASLVYILSAEANGSFWDCGEFVASAFKLQLPHPPGAPLFTLIGRFFIVLFGDNPANAAKAVNVMSAFASGFTILFLFWSVTHFARKLLVGINEEPNQNQMYTIMGAGIVGALAYTFSDSFWYSAVEGEVYALSSFFTALVFWAILKWERADDYAGSDRVLRARADRWIIFIFFMMGLSIGVHLLGLLCIPAIVMIYYFKRYNYTRKGAILAFLIGCAITGIVQVAVIQWTVKYAGKFDILFVNSFGLPFFSGFIFFFIVIGILVWLGLRWAKAKGWSYLRLGLWCFVFMMIGYSTYITTLIRSNANPAIDMNNVDNPMSLVYYLGREQYGEAPLIYGPHFQAQPTGMEEGEMKYVKGPDAYVPTGKTQNYSYDNGDKMLFPRVWDASNQQGHADFYAGWLGLGRSQDPQTGQVKYDAPTYGDNIQWFVTYQLGFMYWRYFMWNFAGKQNDIQGLGNRRDGNWKTGISFIDNSRLGDQSKLPESLKKNKANNSLFFLPFILGIVGAVYQFYRNRKDFIGTFLLFFFTGFAIVLYLNQPGNQPRERDYAYVGSFYAFAIWIGLSVVGFVRMIQDTKDRTLVNNVLLYGSITTFLITMMSNANNTFSASFISGMLCSLLYAAVVAAITYGARAISNKGSHSKTAIGVAFAACMIAPLVMGIEEWDDHDRSEKTLAPSMAKNYLESCAPNAILFTFGDNDTYPLWFAQEVLGVRPDIRIINTSLLGIDWYVNQLRYKINESAPIDVVFTPEQIQGVGYIQFKPQGAQDRYYPLYDVMKKFVGAQTPIASFPVKHFMIPVDTTNMNERNMANGKDTLLPFMNIDLPEQKSYLTLDELTILNIIAANNWKRPIYFTSPYGELGFSQYLRKDGLTYRLVPAKNSEARGRWLNTPWITDKLLSKFTSGGAQNGSVYFDEENRRHLLSVRSLYAETAGDLADKGNKTEAVKVLEKSESLMNPESMPYAMVSRYNQHNQIAMLYLESAYKAGDAALVNKLRAAIRKDMLEQKAYYTYLKNEREAFFEGLADEARENDELLGVLDNIEKTYSAQPAPIENPKRSATPTRDSGVKLK